MDIILWLIGVERQTTKSEGKLIVVTTWTTLFD